MNDYVKGAIAGSFGALAGSIGYQIFEPEKSYIGIDFSNRSTARVLRDAGVLSSNPLDQACKQAVTAWLDSGKNDPVVVELPKRQSTPLPSSAPGRGPGG